MKRNTKSIIISSLLALSMTFSLCACGAEKSDDTATTTLPVTITSPVTTTVPVTEEKTMENTTAKQQQLTVKCTSVTASGKLLTACAASSAGGQNSSPAISWNAIRGATSYAVYMLDTSAGNWMHWRAYNITNTSLTQDGTPSDSEYKGPYPPSGSHTYMIYVFALSASSDSYPGNFDAKNVDIETIKAKLDIAGGKSGNVLCMGSVKTIYAHGDNNV